jgi:hypothetical protein
LRFGSPLRIGMRQHRGIRQATDSSLGHDSGGEANQWQRARVSFQMRRQIAMRETLTACVIGAVFAAVAAVDAAVCEVFVDAYSGWADAQEKERLAQERGDIISTWLPPLVPGLAQRWADDRFRRAPLVERATAAVSVAGRDLGRVPSWSRVDDVVQFRHLLTHYTGGVVWTHRDEPGYPVPDPDPVQKMLEKRKAVLGNKGVTPTPLGYGRVFPYSHLGYSCAVWAVKTSRLAIDEFYRLMDKPSPLIQAEDDDRRRERPSRFALPPVRAAAL